MRGCDSCGMLGHDVTDREVRDAITDAFITNEQLCDECAEGLRDDGYFVN